MGSLYPSRYSVYSTQLENCEICNRPRDNRELRESLAHSGILACQDHPEEFIPGYREYRRDGTGTFFPEQQIVVREEPFGAPLGFWELGTELDQFLLLEGGAGRLIQEHAAAQNHEYLLLEAA